MSRFSKSEYDPVSQTAVIGAGLTWGEVYDFLEPYGVSVVGGRLPQVGVSGVILSGGIDQLKFLPSFVLIYVRYEV